MYVHVCTCMYMYVHVCTCMYMYVHVCTCMYMYVGMHACLYVYEAGSMGILAYAIWHLLTVVIVLRNFHDTHIHISHELNCMSSITHEMFPTRHRMVYHWK